MVNDNDFSKKLTIIQSYLINPMMMANMLSTISTQCETSAKYMASSPSSGWCISTKNRMRQISDPTSIKSPKKSPLDAPTQSTRPCWAWAIATALRDSITSNRCSRSSSVMYLDKHGEKIMQNGGVCGLLKPRSFDELVCVCTSIYIPKYLKKLSVQGS